MSNTTGLDFDHITITDNLMFVQVFSDPERCRRLLERLLGFEIERVVVSVGEHTLHSDIGAKGVRMDVYAKDDAGTIYDVEMQTSDKKNLALRSRYYASSIDRDLLNRGEVYTALRKSFVIFICTYDPIGEDLPCYTITPHCRETHDELPDGCTRLFFNATAWEKCADVGMAGFLRYVEDGTIGDDTFVRDVDRAVRATRQLPSWKEARMHLQFYIQDMVEDGIAEELPKRVAAAVEEELARRMPEELARRMPDELAGAKAKAEADMLSNLARLKAAMHEDGRDAELLDALGDKEATNRLLVEHGIDVG